MLLATGTDLEGSQAKGSQSGRGRLWYRMYLPSRIKLDIQGQNFTIQKETQRIQRETKDSRGIKYVNGLIDNKCESVIDYPQGIFFSLLHPSFPAQIHRNL